MDEPQKVFDLDEANELVPTLELEFGRVARLRAELAPLIVAMGGADAAIGILQGGAQAPPGRERDAARLRRLADEINSAVQRISGYGCLVKDLDMGLVDFYCVREGEPVYLCWQFGEPVVAHWHAVDAGYSSRRPIEGLEIEPPEYVN